jgi:drug/metabolite transporter (DMT)-like permease
LCTAVAYLLYFRLIAHLGAPRAITVTYLIPVFAVLWGALFLREEITLSMAAGCAVILVGTALASGLVTLPLRRRAVT